MGCVEQGKWTCEACNRSLTVYGSAPDVRAAIHEVQRRHGKGHSAWRGRVPMPRSKPRPPRQATVDGVTTDHVGVARPERPADGLDPPSACADTRDTTSRP